MHSPGNIIIYFNVYKDRRKRKVDRQKSAIVECSLNKSLYLSKKINNKLLVQMHSTEAMEW